MKDRVGWRVALLVLLVGTTGQQTDAVTGTRRGNAWSEAQLTQAVRDFVSGKANASAFQTTRLPMLLRQLVRLQQSTPETSPLYRDLTFTLAYLGKDYRRNVRRLIKPVVLYEAHARNWSDYDRTGVHEPDVLEEVPDLISRLYAHNYDLTLLKLLCSWRLDGGPAEVLSATRYDLLARHPREVLKAAQHSEEIAGCMAGAAAFCLVDSDAEYRRFVASIRRAVRRRGSGLRRFTHGFLDEVTDLRRQIRKPYRRKSEQDTTRSGRGSQHLQEHGIDSNEPGLVKVNSSRLAWHQTSHAQADQ
jgi:hypothetical protein